MKKARCTDFIRMNRRSIIFKEIWSQDQGAFYITIKLILMTQPKC